VTFLSLSQDLFSRCIPLGEELSPSQRVVFFWGTSVIISFSFLEFAVWTLIWRRAFLLVIPLVILTTPPGLTAIVEPFFPLLFIFTFFFRQSMRLLRLSNTASAVEIFGPSSFADFALFSGRLWNSDCCYVLIFPGLPQEALSSRSSLYRNRRPLISSPFLL